MEDINRLSIECKMVDCITNSSVIESDSYVKLTLKGVRTSQLINNLIKEIGTAGILDFIANNNIKNYLRESE